jgi:BirA family biotin operon repressor/biotin-[acetyl-CoA-carboxylase] ligase
MILVRLGLVDSTQAFLRRHPELGECAVLAARQTDGRGRWGNDWDSSGSGNLYLSAALADPGLPPGVILQRAMLHVIACLEVPGLGLKWPNDLVAWKKGCLVKLGGIIGELDGKRLLLGLGINLADAPTLASSALLPESLAGLGHPCQDPEGLALRLLAAWQGMPLAPAASFRWPAKGEAVGWHGGQGVVLGWEEDGRLRLANQDGIVRLSSGEVAGLRNGE